MTAFTDPFLDSHVLRSLDDGSAREGVFTIGRNGSSVAMVDQMIRAAMLMERLKEHDILDEKARVCVVGAGFGGATAAIRAAELGAARVCLVDKSKRAFERQAECVTRIIDPTEYHWPYPWFRKAKFPLREDSSYRFPFVTLIDYSNPKSAQRLSTDAHMDLDDRVRRLANLEFLKNTKFDYSERAVGPYKVVLTNRHSGHTRSEDFDLLVFANIIESERTWAVADKFYERGVTFRSFDYWGNDAVVARFVGLRDLGEQCGRRPKMLVSGSGDGGLQDFVYYTTGFLSPRQLLDRVGAGPSQELLAEIMLSTLQCKRMMFWRTGERAYDCQVLGPYHRQMRDHAQRWLEEGTVREQLRALLDTKIDIQLVCKCSHFDRAYPLNAFLALAINEVYASEDGSRGIRYEHEVHHVGHACGDDCGLASGEGCLAAQEVELLSGTSCHGYTGGSPLDATTYDLIVLRHGISWRHQKEQYSAIDFPVPLWFQDRGPSKTPTT